MKLIETQWWSLPVSDEWLTETDDETIIITDKDNVGCLEISALDMDISHPGIEDLRELARQVVPQGIEGEQVRCGQWVGMRYEYVDDDFCRDWVVNNQSKLLLISYTCAIEHRGMDDAAVDQMLDELQSRNGH